MRFLSSTRHAPARPVARPVFRRHFCDSWGPVFKVPCNNPTRSQLKQAFYAFAMTHHPDVAAKTAEDVEVCMQRFVQGVEEYEVWVQRVEMQDKRVKTHTHTRPSASAYTRRSRQWENKDAKYDAWGTGSYRFSTEDTTSKNLTPIERELKRLLKEGHMDEAVDFWEHKQGGDMALLLFMLEVSRGLSVVPNVRRVLRVLHAAETPVTSTYTANNSSDSSSSSDSTSATAVDGDGCGDGSGAGDASSSASGADAQNGGRSKPSPDAIVQETAVQIFHGRKTQAYNDLIRVCTYGGKKQDLFDVLDEMHLNGVEKDEGTFYQIDQAWQNLRQEYSC